MNPKTFEAVTQESAGDWIASYLAAKLNLRAEAIDRTAMFSEYGVDSLFAVVMTGDLGVWIGRDIDPTVLYQCPTVNDLARHVVSVTASRD
jgi:acyl carrier protein